ncbi:hypothetical protein Pcinc_013065 [Petrolisthes cinctipes]|uniref:Uncharacterized protein n=1 Tax=Petrolisthes cinctipes TaxID=88211 RepID=A0AAE1FXK6_PETCI|nr:hypothetical protein Pcinc_013065 [Petrolisthes cinctipes]
MRSMHQYTTPSLYRYEVNAPVHNTQSLPVSGHTTRLQCTGHDFNAQDTTSVHRTRLQCTGHDFSATDIDIVGGMRTIIDPQYTPFPV